jgi:hypothetical protein
MRGSLGIFVWKFYPLFCEMCSICFFLEKKRKFHCVVYKNFCRYVLYCYDVIWCRITLEYSVQFSSVFYLCYIHRMFKWVRVTLWYSIDISIIGGFHYVEESYCVLVTTQYHNTKLLYYINQQSLGGLLKNYYYDDNIKEYDMSGTFSTHRRQEKYMLNRKKKSDG